MELNHLRYFFEVAQSGSFTEAARRLHVSQSALSKAVALLEESEGVKLFTRSKKGVALTAIGADVLERSRAIFRTVSEIEDACRGVKSECEGYLNFGASDHVINYYLMEKIAAFIGKFPKVIPSVSSGAPNETIAAMLENKIEFGLFFTRINIPHVIYKTVETLEMAVVCRPNDAKSLPAKVTFPVLRKFMQQNGFISSIGSQYQHHPSEGLISQVGEFPPLRFECNSQEAQKRFCMHTGGVAYLARFIVAEELKRGSLIEIKLPKKFEIDLLLAKRKDRELSLNAQTFLTSAGHHKR